MDKTSVVITQEMLEFAIEKARERDNILPYYSLVTVDKLIERIDLNFDELIKEQIDLAVKKIIEGFKKDGL